MLLIELTLALLLPDGMTENRFVHMYGVLTGLRRKVSSQNDYFARGICWQFNRPQRATLPTSGHTHTPPHRSGSGKYTYHIILFNIP